jgi:beta-carotene 15,15'-dioxygenase
MKYPLNLNISFSTLLDNQSFSLKLYLFLFGAGLVLFHQFIFPISTSIQWTLFVGTMLVTGIPHGAIDHLVDEQNALNKNKRFSINAFLRMYLGKMVVYGLIWWFFPIVAITIFMGISAFHFGETDLLILPKNKKAEKFLFLSYGWILLNILFLTHLTEVVSILKSLPHFLDAFTNILILVMGKYKIQYFSVCSVLFLVSFINYATTRNSFLPILIILIQGIGILLICTYLPFLLAFAFYFGLWHSLLCFQSIRQYILDKQQISAWQIIAKKAIFFSLIAIFGILFLILLGNYFNQTSNLLFWLFIGIAILTAPHMSVMSTMFSAMKEK